MRAALWLQQAGAPLVAVQAHLTAVASLITEHRDFRLMDFTVVLLHICDNFLLLAKTEP